MDDTLFGEDIDECARSSWEELHENERDIEDAMHILCGAVLRSRLFSKDSDRNTPEDKMWQRWGDASDFGVWEWHK